MVPELLETPHFPRAGSPVRRGSRAGSGTLFSPPMLALTGSLRPCLQCMIFKKKKQTLPLSIKSLWRCCFSSSSYFQFACMCAKLLQSCPTLCDPKDCSPPVSSVCGILQARILEGVVISSSRESSQPKDRTHIFSIS